MPYQSEQKRVFQSELKLTNQNRFKTDTLPAKTPTSGLFVFTCKSREPIICILLLLIISHHQPSPVLQGSSFLMFLYQLVLPLSLTEIKQAIHDTWEHYYMPY